MCVLAPALLWAWHPQINGIFIETLDIFLMLSHRQIQPSSMKCNVWWPPLPPPKSFFLLLAEFFECVETIKQIEFYNWKLVRFFTCISRAQLVGKLACLGYTPHETYYIMCITFGVSVFLLLSTLDADFVAIWNVPTEFADDITICNTMMAWVWVFATVGHFMLTQAKK